MDSDLNQALNSILSDPEQMGKLTALAKDLFGQGGAQPDGERESAPQEASTNAPAIDTRIMSALGKAFAGGGAQKSRSTALLVAMRPYMKPEKQEKLDRAMQIARMANIAGAVMREYGGGDGI